MPDDPPGPLIFLSYSRKDSGLVIKVRLIIWATGAVPWLDTAFIAPGQKWRAAITQSLKDCDRLFLFWCYHSKASIEVRNEYLYAIEHRKTVVPFRLDSSERPPGVGEFNEIELGGWTWWRHELFRWQRLILILGLLILAAGYLYGR